MIQVLVAALTTALAHSRLYPSALPQDVTFPACRHQRIGKETLTTHDGALGLKRSEWQFSCFGETYAAASGMADTVEATLNCYKNATSSPVIAVVFLKDRWDLYSDEDKITHIPVEVTIWHY